MKFLITVICFLSLMLSDAFGAAGQIYTNAANSNGKWSDGATWIGGVAPSVDLESAFITNGIVYYDATNSGFATGWSNITVALNGQLIHTNAYQPWYFLMYSNVAGVGTWNVGASNAMVAFTSSNTPGGIIRWSGFGQCTMTGTNKNNWWGTSLGQLLWSSNVTTAGSITINLSNAPVGIPNGGTNLVIWMGEPQTVGINTANGLGYFVLSGISGTTLKIQTNLAAINAITNFWSNIVLTNLSVTTAVTNAPISFLDCSLVQLPAGATTPSVTVFTLAAANNIVGTRFQNVSNAIFCANNYLMFMSNTFVNANGQHFAKDIIANTVNKSSSCFNQSTTNLYNNYVENCPGIGTGNMGYAAGGKNVYNNWAYNSFGAFFISGNSSGNVISNNVMINCNGSLFSSGDNPHTLTILVSNTIINCYKGLYSSVAGVGFRRSRVEGNTVIGGSNAIAITGSSATLSDNTNNLIIGNTFSNVGGYIITSFMFNNVISNNNFINCPAQLYINTSPSAQNANLWINNNFVGCSNTMSAGNSSTYIGNVFQTCTNSFGLVNGGNDSVISGNTISNCINFSLAYNAYGITVYDTTNLGNGGVPLTTNCFDAKLFNSPSTNDTKQFSIPYSTIQYDQDYWKSDYGYVTFSNNIYYQVITSSNGPVPLSIQLAAQPYSTLFIDLACIKTNNIIYKAGIVTGTGYPYNQQIIASDSDALQTNTTISYVNANPWPQQVTLWVEANSQTNATVTGQTLISVRPNTRILP